MVSMALHTLINCAVIGKVDGTASKCMHSNRESELDVAIGFAVWHLAEWGQVPSESEADIEGGTVDGPRGIGTGGVGGGREASSADHVMVR